MYAVIRPLDLEYLAQYETEDEAIDAALDDFPDGLYAIVDDDANAITCMVYQSCTWWPQAARGE